MRTLRAAAWPVRRVLAVGALWVAAGSCGSPVEPDVRTGINERPARLALRATVTAHRVDALNVQLRASYERRGGETRLLSESVIPLSDVPSQQVAFSVNLSPCLADTERVPQGTACATTIEIMLRSGERVLDRQVIGPVNLLPGQNATVPSAVVVSDEFRVEVARAVDTVRTGRSAAFTARVTDRARAEVQRPLRWRSADTTVARIDSLTGVATARRAGSTSIIARLESGEWSGSATLVVVDGGVIRLSAPAAEFRTRVGAPEPAEQVITVSNPNPVPLGALAVAVRYAPGGPTGWLTATLDQPTAPAALRLRAARGALPPGEYAARVEVSAADAENGPQGVDVVLRVGAQPVLASVTPPAPVAARVGGVAPAPLALPVTAASGDTLRELAVTVAYTEPAQPAAPWLTATLDRTTTPATLSLATTQAGLAAGTYRANVTITSPAAPAPVVVPVEFSVGAQPAFAAIAPPAPVTARVGGAVPPLLALPVTAAAGDTLRQLAATVGFTEPAQPAAPWLTATFDRTTTPATLSLAPTQAGLAAGTYRATVTITSPGASAPVTVPVEFSVAAQPAFVAVTPPAPVSVAAFGPAPAVLSVPIAGAGNEVLEGLVAEVAFLEPAAPPAAWLAATLDRATTPATLTLAPTQAGLAEGTYRAEVRVRAPEAGAPLVVPVTLVVGPRALGVLAIAPATVGFAARPGLPAPAEATVAVTAATADPVGPLAATVTYPASPPAPWLTAVVEPATVPATLRLRADQAGLASGTYTARVAVAAPSAANSPQIVEVTFEVGPQPRFAVAAAPPAFTGAEGGAMPAAAPVAIAAAPGDVLEGLAVAVSYLAPAAPAAPWLVASLDRTVTPAVLTLAPTQAGLAEGRYTAEVRVTAAGAANAAVVPVELVVTPLARQRLVASWGTPTDSTVDLTLTWDPTRCRVADNAACPADIAYTALEVEAVAGGPAAARLVAPRTPLATPLFGTATVGGTLPVTTLASATTEPAGIRSAQPVAVVRFRLAPGAAGNVTMTPVIRAVLGPGQAPLPIVTDGQGANALAISASVTLPEVAAAPAPSLALAPAAVPLAGVAGGAAPAPEAVTITNAGNGVLDGLALGAITYGAGQPTGWLTASALSGTTAPATFTLTASPASLAAGTYT
ncbi:MAG: hypothetical protein NW201_06370, partial [Gemmatimonadales bacterium]|nr:hypothetical protein [Gemmatimonadales bacterium]